MKIGILGAGMIGGTVGTLWHRAGHEVCFGTRHPERQQALVARLGDRARAGTAEEAARFGEVVLLAVPLGAMRELAATLAPLVDGKVVLDANNPYAERDGAVAEEAVAHPAGQSGWVAALLPGARLVKAFNTVYYKVLEENAGRDADGVGIPLAGDDPAALEVAARLVRDAGFGPVVVGRLAEGKRFQPGTEVYNTGMRASAVVRALGVTS
jgi:predicted dinucleotide-binding enzyme